MSDIICPHPDGSDPDEPADRGFVCAICFPDVPAKCDCGAPAVWMYAPTSTRPNPNYCEEHVSRGCSCNIDPTTGVEDTDEQGRLWPCCEYMWIGPSDEDEPGNGADSKEKDT